MEYQRRHPRRVRAGFRTDGASRDRADLVSAAPLTVTPSRRACCCSRSSSRGIAPTRQPAAGDPSGRPGDCDRRERAREGRARSSTPSSELERQWGLSKHHPYFPPGWFTIGPEIFRSDAVSRSPAFFPDRAAVEYVVWYPPRETPEQVCAEIEA